MTTWGRQGLGHGVGPPADPTLLAQRLASAPGWGSQQEGPTEARRGLGGGTSLCHHIRLSHTSVVGRRVPRGLLERSLSAWRKLWLGTAAPPQSRPRETAVAAMGARPGLVGDAGAGRVPRGGGGCGRQPPGFRQDRQPQNPVRGTLSHPCSWPGLDPKSCCCEAVHTVVLSPGSKPPARGPAQPLGPPLSYFTGGNWPLEWSSALGREVGAGPVWSAPSWVASGLVSPFPRAWHTAGI